MPAKYSVSKELDPEVVTQLVIAARRSIAAGETRFSMKKAIEEIRHATKKQINNSLQRAYVDALVEALPAIGPLVERRNTARGKNKLRPELARIDRLLATGAKITAVLVEMDGQSYTVALPPQA